MGAHEYETVVEDTITFLDHCGATGLDVRSWAKALYELQARYDTCENYTHVLPQLVRLRYLYVLPTDERGKTLPCDFSSHPAKEFSAVQVQARYPVELQDERFYIVAGSPAWRALVEAGELHGPDAVAPANLPIEQVVARIVLEAQKHENRHLVRAWLALLCVELVSRGCGRETLAADPDVQIVRRVAKQMDVLAIRDDYFNYGNFIIPPDYAFGDEEALTWFLALDDALP